MDLRALLFTADGGSSATLCQVLTELGIEAEICHEMLVAAGRLSGESYGALIVDWSDETEAAFLLKTAREKKSQSLNIALVSDEASVGRALQQGANSVIKKPIDAEQARDTLSTARDLILSRRTEQRDKEARMAATLAPPAPVQGAPEVLAELPVEEAPAVKTGFLQQAMPRSAFEAEANIIKPDYAPPTNFQVARGPASIQEEQEAEPEPVEPVTKKRWDDVRAVFRETPSEPTVEPEKPAGPEDKTGVFSSPPEETQDETELVAETEPSAPPRYVVFAVMACLLVAGVLYVWAPGGAYLGRLNTILHRFTARTASSNTETPPLPPQPATQASVAEKPATSSTPAGTEEFAGETGPIPSTEVDPNNIQIIETKAIPKAGAQQPPSKDPVPDANTSQSPIAAQSVAPAAADPSAPDSEPQATSHEPVHEPVTVPQPTVPPAPTPVPQNSSPLEGRVGVIIPDSLKSSPSMAPASSLEPPVIPEETSLGLLIHTVAPEYPAQAQQQHLDGPVVLQAWVAKDGSVRDVKLVKGYLVLARAASDAVKQWRFKPYSPNGRAVDFQTMLTVNFKHPN